MNFHDAFDRIEVWNRKQLIKFCGIFLLLRLLCIYVTASKADSREQIRKIKIDEKWRLFCLNFIVFYLA